MSEPIGTVEGKRRAVIGRRTRRRRSGTRTRAVALPVLLAVALSSLVVVAASPAPVAAASFTVVRTTDEPDAVPGDGACATLGDVCTLRAAIMEANASPGPDVITFAITIGGAGVKTIAPTSALPPITDTVTIDGYTQPDATRNTLAVGNDAELRIVLSGSSVGGVAGLDLSASTESRVSGLVINGFSDGSSSGAGIVAGPAAVIEGNFIGTDVTGASSQPNFHGVVIPGVDGVTVGGSTPGERNLISGNTNFGVHLTDDADSNVVTGNYIGTNRAGSAALGNNFGVYLGPATGGERLEDNVIGGAAPGAGNVVSGNFVGVRVDFADDTSVLGNLIGTDATGSAAISNHVGIDVGTSGSSPATRTFRTIIGDGTVAGRNVVSGNNSEGISLWNETDDNVIRGNYVGVAADGFSLLGNNRASTNPDIGGYGGIVLRNNSSGNLIGGAGPGDGNVIADNNDGVVIFSGLGNQVRANSMFDNLGRGLFIFGTDVNDAGDLDEGANRAQNHPVLRRAAIDPEGDLRIERSIDSQVGASTYPLTIEYFLADTAASGEGFELIGTEVVPGPGVSTFDLGPAGDIGVVTGVPMVATATDAAGNTSRFSDITFVDQAARLAPSAGGDRFGKALDVDGNRLVVTSPGADVDGVSNAGLVRVFERTDVDAPWQLVATISAPTPEADARFGDSVALRGDQLAVGESDRLRVGGSEPGRVFLFTRTGPTTWSPTAPTSVINGSEPDDHFGASLAWLDDTRLVIGAPQTGPSDAGRVAVATLSPGGVSLADLGFLPGIEPVAGDEFGFDVAAGGGGLYGDAIVVGAPGRDQLSGPDGGEIYFYRAVGASISWTNSSGYQTGTRAGTAVDISGDRAVAAGYGSGSISVGILEYEGSSWNGDAGVSAGVGFDPGEEPPNDYVAIDGTRIAVGRPGAGGSVGVFERGDSGWPTTATSVVGPGLGRNPGDAFGSSLALDGPTLVVGAPGDSGVFAESPDSGAVFTGRLSTTATFTNIDPFAPWEDPANWDIGGVPGPGDAVVIPFGTYPQLGDAVTSTIDTLSVAGQLRLRGDLGVETSTTIGGVATVDLQSTATFDPSGDVTLDGLLNNGGPVIFDGPGSITGTGRFINDDELRKTGPGTLTLGPDVVWTSRFYSELNVAGGSVEIQGPLLDQNPGAVPPNPTSDDVTAGTFRVAAGTSLEFDGDLIVGPGTRFVTEITGDDSSPANYGRIVADRLGLDQTVPNPGPGLVGFQANVSIDVDASDVYPIISCFSDCAPDIDGDAFAVEFDDLELSGLTPVQTRTAIELRTVANKVVSSDPGIGFGTDVAVDGDLAVVGTLSAGPLWVYRYDAGVWGVAQSLSNGTAERVAIDGTTIFADGLRYNPVTPGGLFDADEVIGGTTFDVDGRLVVRGEPGGPTFVRLAAGGDDAELVPSDFDGSYGADVAVVDLGGTAAIAAVSAPSAGRVYLFDLAVDEFAETVSVTPRSFISGGLDFGRSIALSADRLVVGDPFDGIPIAGAGAARVFERIGQGATFDGDPVKLQPSDADVADTFGDDVAIDGDVIVVGAPIAQKSAFPLRDGAAYVFQNNGAEWIETDILRADDGYDNERFGDAVAVSGNRVLIGAPNDASDNGADAGAFYFYETTPPPSGIATFINPTPNADWNDGANWSTGAVPTSGEAAVVPAGTTPNLGVATVASIEQLTLAGTLNLDGRLELTGESAVSGSGTLFVNSGGVLTIGAALTVDGQVATREGPPPGSIEFETGASIIGSGLIGNSGVVSFTGTGVTTVGAGLTWNSGTNSLLQVTAGTVEVATPSIDLSGITFVAPGAALRALGGLALADTSILEFGIDGPGDADTHFGRLEVPTGTFTANGQVVTTPLGGYLPTGGTYPLITCAGAGCLGGTFDEEFGGRIDTATETEISFVLVNTYVGPAPSVAPGNWDIPFAWSFGVVPGAADEAAIPPGRFVVVGGSAGPDQFAVGSLTVAGRLDVRDDTDGAGGLRFEINDDSVITPTGQLVVGGSLDCRVDGIVTPLPPPFGSDECVPSTTSIRLGADLRVDGSFRVVEAILAYPGGVYITSRPDLELDGGASLSGTGSVMLDANVAKSEPGTVTFGPDLDVDLFYRALEPLRGVLQVTDGTLDIQSAPPNGSFTANGTIEVGPGATVSISGDLTLAPSSEIEIGINGPAAFPGNYGRIVLPTGDLTAAGTLRTEVDGSYEPTTDDVYPILSCTTGACDEGTFDTVDTGALTVDRTLGSLTVQGAAQPTGLALDFGLGLATGAPSTLEVAPTGIAVNTLDRGAISRAGGGDSNVAASSITSIGPEDTSLAAITLGATPLRSIILESTPLRSIPLVNIDIDGGWDSIIRGSAELEKEPLSSLTLGQVLEAGPVENVNTPAGRLAQTPLRSIDVEGTPLASIPLAAIALGATPLRSIPLRSIAEGEPNPWCEIIGDLAAEYPGGCDEAIDDLSLTEVTLRGVPLRSIPLRSIPLRSIELADTPLRSILLEDISLAASPVGAIPLRSIPLRSIELAASPLRSIPLRSIPLRSIPVSAIDLDQPVGPQATPLRSIDVGATPLRSISTSVRLEATPLRSIDTQGTPLSAIQVQGAPLRSIPVSAVVLADTPLRSIPLEEGGVSVDWCDVLASADPTFDCTDDALDSTTLSDLTVRGVPLRSIPLRSIPLRSIDLDATPLRSIPLRSIPLRSIPVGGISLADTDLGAIDVAGTPLRSIPLRSIDVSGTALGAIPLRSIDVGVLPLEAIPLRSIPLRSIPLRSIPLRSIPLRSIDLADTPLRSIDVLASPLRSIPLRSIDAALLDCALIDCGAATLGAAYSAGAILPGATLEDVQSATDGIALGELTEALGVTSQELTDALGQLSLIDLLSLADLTLADLPSDVTALGDVTLAALLERVPVGSLANLAEAVIDPTTGRPVAGLAADIEAAIAALTSFATLGDLEVFGELTLDDLFDLDTPVSLGDIEPILRFITVDALRNALGLTNGPDVGDGILGDLTSEELGQLTLADLSDLVGTIADPADIGDLLTALGVGGLIDDFTLGDLLLALVDPGSLVYDGVDFAQVDVAALPAGTVGSTTFAASFELTASGAQQVNLRIALPPTAGLITGSGEIVVDGGAPVAFEPTLVGSSAEWTFVAQPGVPYSLNFDVLPTLRLGSTSLSGVARVVGTDISVPATASVTVVEGTEPNDFGELRQTTPAVEDVVYLTYITDADDIDVFEIEVDQDDELVVELSNLDADLDLVLWGERSSVGPDGALSRTSDDAPLFAVTDPDDENSDAELLEDFPGLDRFDSTLGVVGVSNAAGRSTETLRTGRLDAGTYYVQVYGANGVTNVQPAALQLKILEADDRPECAPTDIDPFTGLFSQALDLENDPAYADVDTLLLINESRLEQLHGVDDRAIVRAAAERLVAAAAENDSTLGISPVIVPVDAYAAVRDAYAAWDNGGASCDPDAANAVVAAINDAIIDPVRDQLTHVVILGPDELIPMARLADETRIANEYDFRHEFDGDLEGQTPNGRNAFTSVFWESSILSDEPYGDAAARSLGDRYLYVTDLALGRVVETPQEIADALDNYVDFNGTLDIDTATVLGYDFLADGSEAIADTLVDRFGEESVDRELASGPDPQSAALEGWTADRATEKLRAAATNALVSLNAHFDHYRALPAIGDKVVGFDDNLIAAEVRNDLAAEPAVDLAQSLVFSMGCHSGLSVSDITIGRTNVDWAQTLGQLGSLYVGNTGFGYGDTVTVAYTEQLMALFAERVTTPFETGDGSTTVGQALAWAKNDFVAGLSTFSVYDEKAVQESTFYGLPFYRVGLPAVELPAAPTNVAVPDATGTPAVNVSLEPTNEERATESGVYYTNTGPDGEELVIVAPGRPIQPKTVADVSVVGPADPTRLATRARGAIVLGMESTYLEVPDPVIATPVFDEAASQQEPELTSGVFPTRPLDITTSTGPAGERQQLVLATGQYRSDGSIQRLDDDIDVVVYYSADSDDFTPPTIGTVESSITDGLLTVSVLTDATDDVDRVHVLVAEDPGPSAGPVVWRGLDLALGQAGRWTGSTQLTSGTSAVEFIVQAKDTTGNVGYATNKAENFGELDAPPAAPPPPPPADELSVIVPPTPVSGWFTEPVTITIQKTSTPATVSVSGVVLPGTFETGDTFTITEGGRQDWKVTNEAGRSIENSVKIDVDGPPRVTLGTPAATGTPSYASGSRRVDVICQDTNLKSCELDIDGQSVANSDPLPTQPGTYTLNYVAMDALGNETRGNSTFRITLAAAPVILNLTAPTVDRAVTSPVELSGAFADASMPFDSFVASINWGDGTIEEVTVLPPTVSGSGTFSGSHSYEQPGSYEVVVTVTDSGGLFDVEGATVTVVAPAGAPLITGLTAPTTPKLLSEGVSIEATFTDASAPFDTFTAIVDWGDGTTSPASVTLPASSTATGSLVAEKTYSETGVYPVTVTVTDSGGASDSELYEFVVVYDPTTNGRVTGSGTYWSGPEASSGTSRWGAPAFFGYDARYKKNATVPTGETQLRLLGEFLFKSTSYDYLIVNDAVAIAEGVGTAGGKQYRFRVQGVDNGWLDFFQITIWNPTTGAVLYDNGVLYDHGDLVLLGGIKVKGG